MKGSTQAQAHINNSELSQRSVVVYKYTNAFLMLHGFRSW